MVNWVATLQFMVAITTAGHPLGSDMEASHFQHLKPFIKLFSLHQVIIGDFPPTLLCTSFAHDVGEEKNICGL